MIIIKIIRIKLKYLIDDKKSPKIEKGELNEPNTSTVEKNLELEPKNIKGSSLLSLLLLFLQL